MGKLQRQIKQLEWEIAVKNNYLNHQYSLLHKKTNITKLVIFAGIGSFTYGLLLARKKTVPQIIRSLVSTTLTVKKIYQKFLPFI